MRKQFNLFVKKREKEKSFYVFFELAFSLRAQIKIYLVFAGVALLTHKLKCCLAERTHMHANTHPHTPPHIYAGGRHAHLMNAYKS